MDASVQQKCCFVSNIVLKHKYTLKSKQEGLSVEGQSPTYQRFRNWRGSPNENKVVEIPPGDWLGARACSQSFYIPAAWECKKFDIFLIAIGFDCPITFDWLYYSSWIHIRAEVSFIGPTTSQNVRAKSQKQPLRWLWRATNKFEQVQGTGTEGIRMWWKKGGGVVPCDLSMCHGIAFFHPLTFLHP